MGLDLGLVSLAWHLDLGLVSLAWHLDLGLVSLAWHLNPVGLGGPSGPKEGESCLV